MSKLDKSKWLPVQVKDKRMQTAKQKVCLSSWTEEFISNPPVSRTECEELARKILVDKNPELILEFVKAHGRFILYALNKYFPHFIKDDIFAEAIFATYTAALRLKQISGYRTYLISYIFGYVTRYLRFSNTQLSPSKERIRKIDGENVKVKLKEVPIFGAHQKDYHYDLYFESLLNECTKDGETPFDIVARKDYMEYICKSFLDEAEKPIGSKYMVSIIKWLLDGLPLSQYGGLSDPYNCLNRFKRQFVSMLYRNPELFRELSEGLT